MKKIEQLKSYLDQKVRSYNQPNFIKDDPIQIPHRFAIKQDIEIAGLFAATLAWGLRKTIINKCSELMDSMDNAPYDFIVNHDDNDLKRFLNFKHRTFNATDALFFIEFLKSHYQKYDSLESAFLINGKFESMKKSLIHFHQNIFDLEDAPDRTKKHVATPARKSACKRLNMYLRWMVRQDNQGVDFGIWKSIPQKDLICPLDVHVQRSAMKLGLLERKQADWKAAVELTQNLKVMDDQDPVKYDFALFGLGVIEKF